MNKILYYLFLYAIAVFLYFYDVHSIYYLDTGLLNPDIFP